MKALQFDKTGSLDYLKIIDAPKPGPTSGEALLKIKAAAINPSDVKNVLGKMHETSVPRIPGRDFAGVVLEGPSEWVDRKVFGSGGNLGFSRDGTHAEFVAVPITALNPLPKNLTFEQAAAMGVAYLTAWTAVVSSARIQAGETILITGTTGAVGSAAAKIARKFGARVIGTARKSRDIPCLSTSVVSQWLALDGGELPAAVFAATAGRGVDVVFDVVGGPLFEPCLRSLAHGGRHVAVASNPNPRVSFNLVDFYHRELRLFGVDSLKITFEQAGKIFQGLTPGIEDGTFEPPTTRTVTFSGLVEAYRLLGEGKVKEKFILVP